MSAELSSLLLNIALVTGVVVSLGLLLLFTRSVYSFIYAVRERRTFLEITPPAHSDQPALATESLFTALHAHGMSRSLKEKLIGIKHNYSVEIHATKRSGIRFIISCPANQLEIVQKHIQSYAPDAKTKEVEIKEIDPKRILVFKQNNHYAYPLKKHEDLSQDDPNKKFVMCPQCDKPLLGSASRSKNGNYYSYYHCDKRGHKFRVSKQDLEENVALFVSDLKFKQEHIDALFNEVERSYTNHLTSYEARLNQIDAKINKLTSEAREKSQSFSSIAESARKYVNEELEQIDQKINALEVQKMKLETQKPMDIKAVLARAKYFVEHLEELTLQQIDPIKKAQVFGLIFDKLPTYEDLKSRTQKTPHFTGVNPLFQALSAQNSIMVIPRGIEPLLPG